MDGILIKLGGRGYSIPVADIVESFKAKASQITQTEADKVVIRVREEIIPVLKLYELFKVEPKHKDLLDGIIMVIQSNGKKIGILVDEIVGNQQIVVKSLSNYLGSVKGVSGCSIMANGEISLIIDSGSLIKHLIA